MTRTTTMTAHHWAKQICAAWQSSVRSIIKCGRLLIAAKDDLKKKGKHGQFERMIENELPFSTSTAQRLMKIAGDPRLTNPAHVQLLPPHWGTLYELTKLSNAEFDARIADGRINPDMERRDVEAIGTDTTTITSPPYVEARKPQPTPMVYVESKRVRGPAIGYAHPVAEGIKSITAETVAAMRRTRDAHRVIESLRLLEALLVDEATANEVVELLRARDEDLFRVMGALQALADLKAAVDSRTCVH